jgi:ATP-binding cassette, subfamily C, bacterial CydD
VLLNRNLLAIAASVPWPIAATVALGLAVLVSRVAQAILLAQLLATLVTQPAAALVSPVTAGLALSMLARAVLLWLRELLVQRTAYVTKLRVRETLFRKLVRLGPGQTLGQRTGELRSMLVDGVESLETYFGRYLPALIEAVVGPLAIVALLVAIDAWLATIVLVAALFTILAPLAWRAAFEKRSAVVWTELGRLDADFVDSVQGLTTLKAFDATGRWRSHLASQAERVRRVSMAQLRFALMQVGVQRLGTLGGLAGAAAYAALRTSNGELAFATLLMVVFLVPEVFRPLDQLGALIHNAFSAVSAATAIRDLLESPEPGSARVPSRRTPQIASVEFEHVTFVYPRRDTPALRDVSFRIEPGERVAVMGRSGAGKSTLVALLLGFFDPASGSVRLGGVDVRGLPAEALYDLVAVVSQDTFLFHGTIGDNIALGSPGATQAAVEDAARAAGVDRFVRELPDGYRTEVGERGLQLSGGQRQRIAIARALLKNAPVLVLDEATSSVDGATEAAILATLDEVSRGRTTMVIAHRLSTIQGADRIVVLDDGAVSEVGTPVSLAARDGIYHSLAAAHGVPA